MLRIFAILAIMALAGCEDRFRYPCQDPKNWESPDCKPPTCTALGTCPDMLVKPEERK
jgi:hypothetical protein